MMGGCITYGVSYVPIKDRKDKIITISLSEKLLSKLDRIAKDMGSSRSYVIQKWIDKYIIKDPDTILYK
jgi:metal-responsive CopG/Arc/MetJ family transcriptional regulator